MTDQDNFSLPEFQPFPKIPRLARPCVITEKIDGTNGVIFVTESGNIFAGSKNRWLTASNDNFGFAKWVEQHTADLLTLGPGRHHGEWWGLGIQRGYGLAEKRFSLFNTFLWGDARPACCHVVPVLYAGIFDTMEADRALWELRENGSMAAPCFRNPEGVVIYHEAAKHYFKKTLEKDDAPKLKEVAA